MPKPQYRPIWSQREINVLRAHINAVSFSQISSMLPGRTIDAVKRRASLLKLDRTGKHFPKRSIKEDFFSMPTLLSSYWAGFIAADGCVVTSPRTELRIGIHVKDIKHLQQFALDSGYDGPISIDKKNICHITVCAAHQWVKDLDTIFNIGPKKTFSLRPPNLTVECALAYSIGFIDGDGCWATMLGRHGSRYLYLIVVGTRPMLTWLAQTWRNAGANIGTPNLSFCKVWRLSLGASKADSVAQLLKDLYVPRLQRKWRVARREATGQKEE